MKQNTQVAASQTLAVTKPLIDDQQLVIAKRVDEIASGAMSLFKEVGSFSQELQVAKAMGDLQLALTDEMMEPVMALMNTDLGFRTDRDPNITAKDKDGNPMTPYPVEVVRRVFIESKLRGFHSVGNEWNILAARFYPTKNGLKRKLDTFPGLTDLRVSPGVPEAFGEKGAKVPVKATWRRDGKRDELEAEIPIRVNTGMGVDAIIGKAVRKTYARIIERLTGVSLGDEEEISSDEVPASAAPKPTFEKTIDVETVGKPQPSNAATAAAPSEASTQSNSPGVSSSAKPAAENLSEGVKHPSAAAELEEKLKAAGFTWEDFSRWAKHSGMADTTNMKGFADLGPAGATRWNGAIKGLITQLKAHKG
jgi:hypothetical protein